VSGNALHEHDSTRPTAYRAIPEKSSLKAYNFADLRRQARKILPRDCSNSSTAARKTNWRSAPCGPRWTE